LTVGCKTGTPQKKACEKNNPSKRRGKGEKKNQKKKEKWDAGRRPIVFRVSHDGRGGGSEKPPPKKKKQIARKKDLFVNGGTKVSTC